MSFAYVDFSWSQYCIAVLAERMQYRTTTLHGFKRFDLANAEQAISNTFKVKNKIARRPAHASNVPVLVSAILSYGKLRAAVPAASTASSMLAFRSLWRKADNSAGRGIQYLEVVGGLHRLAVDDERKALHRSTPRVRQMPD
jgi:hypothetical protein